MKDARNQAQEIVENAKKQGEVSREEIITTARAESARMKESAVAEIANEREKAIAAVREEVVA
ncbi:F0F1 ATP synthase subunit B, partial [Streptococcus pneumoniae]|nr:F0F1 ATP synthase subunit B [Streptococcus pneumoniae]